MFGSIGVRRLTPLECERLQTWPEGRTRFAADVVRRDNQWHIKPGEGYEQADGPRYKQAGNGVTTAVAFWIGKRIVSVTNRADEIARTEIEELL